MNKSYFLDKDYLSRMQAGLGTSSPGQKSMLESVLENLPANADSEQVMTEMLERLRSMTDNTKNEDEMQAERLSEYAAVSGWFDPELLYDMYRTGGDRYKVLSKLACSCITVSPKGTNEWIMDLPERRSLLAKLEKSGRLADLLSSKLPPTSPDGELLREILSHGQKDDLNIPEERLVDLSFVQECTSEMTSLQIDQSEILNLLARAQMKADLDALLSKGFFGREKELEQINNFILYTGTISFCMILSGMGGSGKSTLLAKGLKPLLDDGDTMVSTIDFDKPGINPSDLDWMNQEIQRQILIKTSGSSILTRRTRSLTGNTRGYSKSSSHYRSSSRSLELDIQSEVMREVRFKDYSIFMLVLDTFEEVTKRGTLLSLFRWIWNWQRAAEDNDILFKVMISGRLSDHDLIEIGEAIRVYVMKSELIPLGALDKYAARDMLLSNGISPERAVEFAEEGSIPKSPLELKILARLLTEYPDMSVQDFLGDLKENTEVSEKYFAATIYKRVLLRIDNKLARQLAYPGLVLRYVNNEIIRELLIPALGLHYDEDTIKKSIEELSAHRWLVYKDVNGNSWHRRDLRRNMLTAIWAKEREKAEKITQEAIRYFREKNMQTEMLYHILMSSETKTRIHIFDEDKLRKLAPELVIDAEDLPPQWAATIRYFAGTTLSNEDILRLPDEFVMSAYNQRGEELLETRDFSNARRLMHAYHAKNPNRARPYQAWEIETLFALVEWEEIQAPRQAENPGKQLQYIAGAVYPAVFTSSLSHFQLLAMDALERIGTILKDVLWIYNKVFEASMITHLRQFSTGMLKLYDISPDRVKDSYNLHELFRLFLQIEKGNDFLFNDRNIYLLCRLLNMNFDPQFRMPFTDINLHPHWLKRLKSMGARLTLTRFDTFDTQRLDQYHTQSTGELLDSKTLLHHVDGMLSQVDESGDTTYFIFEPVLFEPVERVLLFRGPDPELRDPCRYALIEAFTEEESRLKLAAIFREIIPYPLTDLEDAAFIKAMRTSPEDLLDDLVEITDRLWSLGTLLKRAFQLKPQHIKLALVKEAFEEWDKVIKQAILKLK